MAQIPPRERSTARFASSPLYRALGMRQDGAGRGYVRFRVEPVAASADGDGAVSSLAITTAADQTVVSAVATIIERGREDMNGTAEMNLTYLGAPRGAVTVTGRVLHKASHLAIVEIEVRDESDALVATGRGSYAIRPLARGPAR